METATVETVPLARYDAYKDSGVEWLGKIPEHWEAIRMKRLYKDVSEKNKPEAELLSVTQNQGVVPRSWVENRMVMPSGALHSFKFICEGDFAISLRSFEGGLEYCYHDGIISPAYTVLRNKRNLISGYYKYLFKSQAFISELQTSVVGIREGKNISYPELSYSFLPVPATEEQIRIANFLDQKTAQIDQAIAQKERLIALLQERRQVMIHQAVTQGLNPDVPVKDSEVEWIGKIPAHWEVKRLKFISSVQSGVTLGKSYFGKKLPSYPYIRVANVQAGYFNLDSIAEINIPNREAAKYFVRVGDILVTEGGDLDKLGRGTVWKGEIQNCLHQNHIFAIRVNRSIVTSKYASLTLESDYGRKYFTTTANKTTNLASTNSTKLGNFPVVVPPLAEQADISEYTDTISKKIADAVSLKEKEIDNLRLYKMSLINSAVTGKIKV